MKKLACLAAALSTVAAFAAALVILPNDGCVPPTPFSHSANL
ncbi:hypothetical protein [Alicyclobacillus shizuokensis]|nr:hypothetical protein [Alicyclobacillus shizuokensis]